jgi:hypothetical protein
MYLVDGAASIAGEETRRIPLLEAPPPFPGFRTHGAPAPAVFRMIRPGEIATPEELARMQAVFGDGAQIEVRQTIDGTIQRVTILRRRSPDESSIDFPGTGIGSDRVISAGTAIRSDVVH